MKAGDCFACGTPVPLRFFCTCGKRECIDRLGDNARPREIREWLIYRASIRRGLELAKEHAETFVDTSEIYWEAAELAVDKECG